MLYLVVTHTAPGVSVSGTMDPDNFFPLRPGTVTIGRSSVCDIIIEGALIGGYRNCCVCVAPDGTCTIFHTGHRIPVLLNGNDLRENPPAPLNVDDYIELVDARTHRSAVKLVVVDE